jgi:hypothetical protein
MIRTPSRAALDPATAAPAPSFTAWLGHRFAALRRTAPLIDPDTLPDTLRRDLGFVDGRGASRHDPRWD